MDKLRTPPTIPRMGARCAMAKFCMEKCDKPVTSRLASGESPNKMPRAGDIVADPLVPRMSADTPMYAKFAGSRRKLYGMP